MVGANVAGSTGVRATGLGVSGVMRSFGMTQTSWSAGKKWSAPEDGLLSAGVSSVSELTVARWQSDKGFLNVLSLEPFFFFITTTLCPKLLIHSPEILIKCHILLIKFPKF